MLNKTSTTLLVLSGAWKTCAGWPVIWFHLWDLCHAGLTSQTQSGGMGLTRDFLTWLDAAISVTHGSTPPSPTSHDPDS